MTDEAQATLPACELCGASADELCQDWCEGYAVEALAPITPPEESKARLMSAVHRLPYQRMVADDVPQRAYMSEEEWLSRLADWMVEYESAISRQVLKLEADSKRAIGLQIEKDIVRGFLGLAS